MRCHWGFSIEQGMGHDAWADGLGATRQTVFDRSPVPVGLDIFSAPDSQRPSLTRPIAVFRTGMPAFDSRASHLLRLFASLPGAGSVSSLEHTAALSPFPSVIPPSLASLLVSTRWTRNYIIHIVAGCALSQADFSAVRLFLCSLIAP